MLTCIVNQRSEDYFKRLKCAKFQFNAISIRRSKYMYTSSHVLSIRDLKVTLKDYDEQSFGLMQFASNDVSTCIHVNQRSEDDSRRLRCAKF